MDSARIQLERVKRSLSPFVSKWDGISVYSFGSLARARAVHFNQAVSDTDMMCTSTASSSADIARVVEQVVQYTKSDAAVEDTEFFYLSSSVSARVLSVLPVVTGVRSLNPRDLIFGEPTLPGSDRLLPLPASNSYKARCSYVYSTLRSSLPDADSSRARRTAKQLLRLAKVVVCAEADARNLFTLEAELMQVYRFADMEAHLQKCGIKIDCIDVFDAVLDGKNVSDWPRWMQAQEGFLSTLAENQFCGVVNYSLYRAYEIIGRIAQDRLLLGVKRVINAASENERTTLRDEFIHDTASDLVALALSGMPELGDLHREGVPARVKEANFEIIEVLSGVTSTYRHFGAAIVLLEYALSQSITMLNEKGDWVKT